MMEASSHSFIPECFSFTNQGLLLLDMLKYLHKSMDRQFVAYTESMVVRFLLNLPLRAKGWSPRKLLEGAATSSGSRAAEIHLGTTVKMGFRRQRMQTLQLG